MKKEYVQPFLQASKEISEEFFGVTIDHSEISLEGHLSLDKEVVIALGIKGDLVGIALFGLSQQEADLLSSHVLQKQGLTKERSADMGMSENEWEELKKSVLKEYGNLVVGYVTRLYGDDKDGVGNTKTVYRCDITTPSFVDRAQLARYSNKESIRFALSSELVQIHVKLHIQKS